MLLILELELFAGLEVVLLDREEVSEWLGRELVLEGLGDRL
jgi:hypothetical protein